jgi:hypothetical protein
MYIIDIHCTLRLRRFIAPMNQKLSGIEIVLHDRDVKIKVSIMEIEWKVLECARVNVKCGGGTNKKRLFQLLEMQTSLFLNLIIDCCKKIVVACFFDVLVFFTHYAYNYSLCPKLFDIFLLKHKY